MFQFYATHPQWLEMSRVVKGKGVGAIKAYLKSLEGFKPKDSGEYFEAKLDSMNPRDLPSNAPEVPAGSLLYRSVQEYAKVYRFQASPPKGWSVVEQAHTLYPKMEGDDPKDAIGKWQAKYKVQFDSVWKLP